MVSCKPIVSCKPMVQLEQLSMVSYKPIASCRLMASMQPMVIRQQNGSKTMVSYRRSSKRLERSMQLVRILWNK